MKVFAFLSAFAAVTFAAVGDDCTGSDGAINNTACATDFTEFCQNKNGSMTCIRCPGLEWGEQDAFCRLEPDWIEACLVGCVEGYDPNTASDDAWGDDCTGSDGASNSTACASGFTEFCQNDNGSMTCKSCPFTDPNTWCRLDPDSEACLVGCFEGYDPNPASDDENDDDGSCESSSDCGEAEYCMENEFFGEIVSKNCEACPEALGFISVGTLCGDSDDCKEICGSAAGTALSFAIALVVAFFYKF